MKTLKDLLNDIENLIKKNPEYLDLPIIYCDENVNYRKIHSSIIAVQIHDLEVCDLELVGFLGDDNIDKREGKAYFVDPETNEHFYMGAGPIEVKQEGDKWSAKVELNTTKTQAVLNLLHFAANAGGEEKSWRDFKAGHT